MMPKKTHKIPIIYGFFFNHPTMMPENIEKNMYPTMMPENIEKNMYLRRSQGKITLS